MHDSKRNALSTSGLFLAVILLTPLLARAQGVTTATLRGEVIDVEGEALPGANVVVLGPDGAVLGGAAAAAGGAWGVPRDMPATPAVRRE